MTPRWRTFPLLAPITVVLVGIVLLSGWLCFRVGVFSATDTAEARRLLKIELTCTALVVLVAMAWLGLRLRQRWLAPVERIADAVDRLAAGSPEARAELPVSAGPMYDFARRVNTYAEQVQLQSDELRQQRADLTSATDASPDPIIVADAQQRIVLINEPAAKFLSLTVRQAQGQKLISVLGEASLMALYEALQELPASASAGELPNSLVREIRVLREGQRLTYQAVAARTSTGGVLVVLRDVTSLAQAVQMKTDFVANASHELRTPIAAIKIAFDTLSEVYTEDQDQTARCIQIIGGHMQRLEAMLQDLLDLSRVENADLKPEYTDLRGVDMLAVTRSAMGPLARNKSLDLALTVDPPTLEFRSDRKLLDLILKNLVENSIKYTPEGGRVTVTLAQDANADGQIVLRVEDTGIGIPPQHLERVFERFYQVDSARSGSSGRGTGLGLAIVKHAALALHGQVSIDSTVGVGTTVTCTLPSPSGTTA